MHLQVMGPVQALLPLLYECQTGCCGSRRVAVDCELHQNLCIENVLLAALTVNCRYEHL